MKQNKSSILILGAVVALAALVGMDLIKGSQSDNPEPTPEQVESAPAQTPTDPAQAESSPLGEENDPQQPVARSGERAAM